MTSDRHRPIVIFGAGDIADIAAYYFERDGIAEVVAHTVDRDHLDATTTAAGAPIVPFDEIQRRHPPTEVAMFVALSYNAMNSLRRRKVDEARGLGYELVSYVSPDCTYRSQYPPGANAFVFEDNTVQPFVRIGENVVLWSGNHIGHHSVIEDDVFVSSHVVISGHCTIGAESFLGVNSTIAHGVTIGQASLVGAAAVITKDTEPESVYVPARSTKLDRSSRSLDL